jgi:WhiB family redox-sensing transcriptional regulator
MVGADASVVTDVTQLIAASLGSEVQGFDDLFSLLASITPAWHADALCREHPEVDFFPTKGGQSERAKGICARCLVSAQCLEWALDEPAWLPGVWGGTTAADRRKLRRKVASAA